MDMDAVNGRVVYVWTAVYVLTWLFVAIQSPLLWKSTPRQPLVKPCAVSRCYSCVPRIQ